MLKENRNQSNQPRMCFLLSFLLFAGTYPIEQSKGQDIESTEGLLLNHDYVHPIGYDNRLKLLRDTPK